MEKPYAESCDRNCDPILDVIKPLLSNKHSVLEVGSGTGQHAIYFATKLPHLRWVASDRKENHAGIHAWLEDAGQQNIEGPLVLDVSHDAWPDFSVDAVFSANTAHIMHWNNVEDFFAGVGQVLNSHGDFILYGPFSFDGQYSAESNRLFDERLRQHDPESGIRHFEALDDLAKQAGLVFKEKFQMPANNHILHWQKEGV